MNSKKTDLIEKWLKEGTDDAKNVIGLQWKVEKKNVPGDGISLIATHLRFPLPLIFKVDDYNTTIILDLGVDTDSMDVRDRMEIYRNLLKINTQIPYAKIGLVGDDLKVVIYAEIETKVVEPDVLNDHMEVLINGLNRVANSLGLQQELIQLTMENITSFIENKKNSGMKKEEIENYLVKKLAIPEENVKELVERVYKKEEKDSEMGILYA